MKKIIPMLLAALLLAACVSAPQSGGGIVAPEPADQAPVAPAGAEAGVVAVPGVTTEGLTESGREALQQGLQDKSIYFDFDRFVVKHEYRELLRQHANILQSHPNDTVTLEGNADERGSAEYNLAIGNKRAYAVKSQLALLGVADSRIQLVSYGEEKPRATCHDESCWQQNRRVDFVYRLNN